MLKQMWTDITTGWGTWRDWGLGLFLICIVVTLGLVVLGVPTFLMWWLFGVHPDTGIMVVLAALALSCWAYSAYERSQ